MIAHPADGERRKLESHAVLETHRERFILMGRRALLDALLDRGTATVDDIRAAVELPPGIGPKLFGCAAGPLAIAGIIRRAGFTQTTRREAHARYVTRWELVDSTAAVAWLAAHPEPPPETPNAPVAAGASAQRSLF